MLLVDNFFGAAIMGKIQYKYFMNSRNQNRTTHYFVEIVNLHFQDRENCVFIQRWSHISI